MWKPEQLAADRSGLRYPSDLSDAEAAIVHPMIHRVYEDRRQYVF